MTPLIYLSESWPFSPVFSVCPPPFVNLRFSYALMLKGYMQIKTPALRREF
jgi:hypothetical protein